MIVLLILLALAASVGIFFAWTAIHEHAHLFMAKKTVGVLKHEMKLYPHKDPKYGFRWASVQYWMPRQATPEEQYKISMAPRIPDFIAVGLLTLWLLFLPVNWWTALPLGFLAGGLVDLITGTIARSPYHDLNKAAVAKGIKPWKIQLVQVGVILLPVAAAIFRLVS